MPAHTAPLVLVRMARKNPFDFNTECWQSRLRRAPEKTPSRRYCGFLPTTPSDEDGLGGIPPRCPNRFHTPILRRSSENEGDWNGSYSAVGGVSRVWRRRPENLQQGCSNTNGDDRTFMSELGQRDCRSHGPILSALPSDPRFAVKVIRQWQIHHRWYGGVGPSTRSRCPAA